MIKVLLVDDDAFVRNGLQYFLQMTTDITVVSVASNGTEAVAQARSSCPDVAILDIFMPNIDGIEAARQICSWCLWTRILMLSLSDNPEYIRRSLAAGASGYVLKDVVGIDLLDAIRTLYRGRRYFSGQISEIADQFFSQKGEHKRSG
jgi:DNA-binding NarL/FixJ family response regulator